MISQSKILRSVIYRLWELSDSNLDSKSFYHKDMGILIGKYLEILKSKVDFLKEQEELAADYS